MAIGVEIQEIPKGLDRYDFPESYRLFRNGDLKKGLQRSPCTVTKLREESAVIQEVAPEDLEYAKDEEAMGNSLQNLLAEPLAEFHEPLLVTGRTEMSPFASKGQEIFVSAILAPDPGESVMGDATVKIAIDDLLYIRA